VIILYGIKNCDTVKKARKWLEAEGLAHRFHDFRKDGLNAAMIAGFEAALGWESLLNTRGTTWRKLADNEKSDIDRQKAQALMLRYDAIIKRPVWEKEGEYRLGFAAKDQEALKQWAKG
jgi:Spx/MgsR family transcriptional regulator